MVLKCKTCLCYQIYADTFCHGQNYIFKKRCVNFALVIHYFQFNEEKLFVETKILIFFLSSISDALEFPNKEVDEHIGNFLKKQGSKSDVAEDL